MRILCFSDLHRSVAAADRVAERARREGAGALVSAGDLATDEDHEPALYAALASAGKPIFSVPGNHDGLAHHAHWPAGALTDLDGKQVELGGYLFAGWGICWMDQTLAGANRRGQREDPVLRLIMDRLAGVDPARVVFVSHLPPWGVRAARDALGDDWGNAQLREWVEAFQPAAVVCGHVHRPRAQVSRIGNTMVVNGGPEGYLLVL